MIKMGRNQHREYQSKSPTFPATATLANSFENKLTLKAKIGFAKNTGFMTESHQFRWNIANRHESSLKELVQSCLFKRCDSDNVLFHTGAYTKWSQLETSTTPFNHNTIYTAELVPDIFLSITFRNLNQVIKKSL